MKKKSIMMTSIAIVVLVIALIISLVFVFNHGDTKAYNSKLEQAQKYVSKLDYKKAEDAYLQAIDIDPKQATAYNELADLYMNNGEEEKAASILKKGYKAVNDSGDKTKIKEKQDKVENKVINNGGEYVTYKGKSYYWEYNNESFRYWWLPRYTAENNLICIDKKGNKKTIYKGTGNGGIWIYNNRIYTSIVGIKYFRCFSLNLDGSDIKEFGAYGIEGVCNEGIIVTNTDINDKNYGHVSIIGKEIKRIISNWVNIIHIENNNIYYESNNEIKSFNTSTNRINKLVKIGSTECIGRECKNDEKLSIHFDNIQIINDIVYFDIRWSIDVEGEDDKCNEGIKIAKVKKDGSDFDIIQDVDDYDFSVYINKDGKEIVKLGGTINRPYTVEDDESEGNTAYLYFKDNSERQTVLTSNEVSEIGTSAGDAKYTHNTLFGLRYANNTLYFNVYHNLGYYDESDDYIDTSFILFCRKDLVTDKITVYQKVEID